jgi:hypothetical protein
MATLLKFRRPDEGVRRPQSGRRRPRGRSAEITIFPGVRIERHGQRPNDRSRTLRDRPEDSTGETA